MAGGGQAPARWGAQKSEDPWTTESPTGTPQRGHRLGRVLGAAPVTHAPLTPARGVAFIPGCWEVRPCPGAMSWVGLWAGGHCRGTECWRLLGDILGVSLSS